MRVRFGFPFPSSVLAFCGPVGAQEVTGGPGAPGAAAPIDGARLPPPAPAFLGQGGTGMVPVDGQETARKSLDHDTAILLPQDASFDVSLDARTGVAMVEYRYDSPFPFTGTIDLLTFKLHEAPTPAP